MLRFLTNKTFILTAVCCALVAALGVLTSTRTVQADDLSGRELLSVTRVAQGGAEYSGLQFVTAKANGFVNVAPIAGAGLGTGGAAAAVEVKLNLTDYQDKDSRRRLDVTPTGAGAAMGGPTFLVYTGSAGGGMYLGNEFRVSEVTSSRHWGLMGFGTLNRAVDGQLVSSRKRDDGNNYVVEVKFNSDDTVRYYIDKNTFLTNKIVTFYNGKMILEEDRSDYRKVSCMMLPFRIVTKLNGQRLADLAIDSYDLKTQVPEARFTITAVK